MYIEPNTVIKFLTGVRLEPTYQNTIYFANKTAQYNYFNSKTKIQRTDRYFQRHSTGSLKVNIPVEDLYDCNYMMFQNSAFTNKWFYAFILNVDYVNNTTSIVYFAIDFMQTWFFDYTIEPSFVLREHSQTDVAGDNIVPETIGADIQYINSVTESKITCQGNYAISSMEVRDDYTPTDPDEPHHYDFIAGYTKDPSSGLSFPYEVYAIANAGDETYLTDFINILLDAGQGDALMGVVPYYNDVSVSLSRPAKIGTYTPKNKKLLTGQFCRYTFELGGNIMEVPMDVVPSPTVSTLGKNSTRSIYGFTEYKVYLNSYANASFPTSMSLTIPVNVQKWAYNDYANTTALQSQATAMMLAREKTEWGREAMNSTVKMGTSVMEQFSTKRALHTAVDPIGSTASRINLGLETANEAINVYELGARIDQHSEAIARHHANMNAPATGATINSNKLLADEQLYLSGYVWTVLPQDAERIDKFFDMYGYAVNTVKIPNRNFRPHWNYVQTSGLEMIPSCPTSDAEMIKKIYEAGITFWNNGDEIGNYTLDNSIVITP